MAENKRHWFRFGLRTLFVASLICAIVFGWPHIWRRVQFQRLKSYDGRDIRELSEQESQAFAGIVATLTGEPETTLPILFKHPWYVWRYRSGRADRYLLLQVTPLITIPGTASAHVIIFNSWGQIVSDVTFSTGWRIDVADARFEPSNSRGFPCLKMTTYPVINGSDIGTQYYAIINDEVALIRLEDGDGDVLINQYHAPNHTIGPPQPSRSPEEWVNALQSKDSAEVLRTLSWLGGGHSNPPIANAGDTYVEDYEAAKLVANVRAKETVKATLKRLVLADDDWIRVAAESAISASE